MTMGSIYPNLNDNDNAISNNTIANMPSPQPKRLCVFCDGTWAGKETNTHTNIQILAEMVGVNVDRSNPPPKYSPYIIDPPREGIKGGYFEGVGLGRTFLDYLWDGATGATLSEETVAAYKYIVENFEEGTEIWMWGFSRGAYTIRAVAGMINNCGIIKPRSSPSDTHSLCTEIYKIYRSNNPTDAPDSPQSIAFRSNPSSVWQTVHPIKFMGLIDTVGALGIPTFSGGATPSFPTFHDTMVSSVVEKVYQGLCMHDRIWTFEPCHATRSEKAQAKYPELEIHEKWFPGAHYDVGRQRFNFVRNSDNFVEDLLGIVPRLMTPTVFPNEVCSDLILRWMLDAVMKEDQAAATSTERASIKVNGNRNGTNWGTSSTIITKNPSHRAPLIPTLPQKIHDLTTSIRSGTTPTGSGDVYPRLLHFVPYGTIWASLSSLSSLATKVMDTMTPGLKLGTSIQNVLGVNSILRILIAMRDRRIADVGADVCMVTETDEMEVEVGDRSASGRGGGREGEREREGNGSGSIFEPRNWKEIFSSPLGWTGNSNGNGKEERDGKKTIVELAQLRRYRSRTYQRFWLWCNVAGRIGEREMKSRDYETDAQRKKEDGELGEGL